MNIDHQNYSNNFTTTTTTTTTDSINSPASPSPSITSLSSSSFQASPVHHSNLALIHPSNSLASLSISSPPSIQPLINPISTTATATAASNNSSNSNNNNLSPISPLTQLPTSGGHLQNRSIPPPLSLGSALSKSSQDPSNPPSDELMTARCSQFPIDSLEPSRHPSSNSTTITGGSCRFQPYLPPSISNNNNNNNNNNNDSSSSSNWSSSETKSRGLFLHTQLPTSGSFRSNTLDDGSLSSSELRSSCSSLASSTASSQSSGYFPPPSTTGGGSLPFEDPNNTTGGCPSENLYPPLAGPGFSQTAVYPAYTGPNQQRSSLAGLAYPAAAFTPSGGSPPIPSASSAYFHFDSSSVVGAGRRHTVSAYASSPMPIELNLVGHPEIDETLIKEEKRRRNKESSQRFRDRTRERQREKQERLEYLERRTKQLEAQLRSLNRNDSTQESGNGAQQDGPPPPTTTNTTTAQNNNQGRSEEREMIERLQAENEALRASLKTASEEINRLQQHVTGNQSPHTNSPLGMSQVYANTLAQQLSPPASTSEFTPGSQASSPGAAAAAAATNESSYFGPSCTSTAGSVRRTASPSTSSSDSPAPVPSAPPSAPSAAVAVDPGAGSIDPRNRVHQLSSFNNHLPHLNQHQQHPQQQLHHPLQHHQHTQQHVHQQQHAHHLHHQQMTANPNEFWDHNHSHHLHHSNPRKF